MIYPIFRNDILSKGAILGCVMLALNMAKSSMFYYGGTNMALPLLLLFPATLAIYILLMFRFTRNYANMIIAEREQNPFFAYGEGLLYVTSVSMLAGVVVGFGEHLFMHYVIGYENFLDAYVKLCQDTFSQLKLTARDAALVNEFLSEWQKVGEPSVFENIIGTVWTYLVMGSLLGFIVAAKTKLNPRSNNNFNNFV